MARPLHEVLLRRQSPAGAYLKPSRKQNAGGFTLLEVLLVVGLLALLLWLVSPNLFSAYQRGESRICTARAEILRRAVVEYMADHGGNKPADGETDLGKVVDELRKAGYLDGEENIPKAELLACGTGTFSLTYGDDGKPKVEWIRSVAGGAGPNE
ncbi:MAG: prepilin-type N-terminal cleavage/methylation domain-containing protein [Brockia lithotrophica]|nr:prepilin-type N-terminal cleavage/methylation domain-containing protein [Brockia lithotrophica]